MSDPSFSSLATREGRFDYGDVIFAPLPPSVTSDPRKWAETVFSRPSVCCIP